MKSLITILLFIFYAGILQSNAQCNNYNGNINDLPVCGVYGNSSGVSNWNWEDINEDGSNNYCYNWYARIDGSSDLTPMGSPFINQGIGALNDIRLAKDFTRAQGWELLRRDFGCGQATKYPYFVLYNRYSGLLRVFIYVPPSSDNFTGIAVEIAPRLNGDPYPATTAFTDTIQTAPDRYINETPGAFGKGMVAIGQLGGASRWSMAEFRPSFDPYIQNSNYSDAYLEIKPFGITTNNMYASIRGGSITGSSPVYNFSYSPTQNSGPSQPNGTYDFKAIGEQLTKFTTTANSFRKDLNDAAKAVINFLDIKIVQYDDKSDKDERTKWQKIKDYTETTDAFDKAIKITAAVSAVSSVFSVVNTILGVINGVSGGAKTGPTYTSYDLTLQGTISTKELLTPFILQVPGTIQTSNSNLTYYKCPMGIFNLKNTPEVDSVTYARTDRYRFEKSDPPYLIGGSPVTRIYTSYRIRNNIAVSYNDQAGLDLVSVQAAFVGEVLANSDGTASYDLFEPHGSTTPSSFLPFRYENRNSINHLRADYEHGILYIKKYDTQKKLHVFQSPYTNLECLQGLAFNVPATTKVYLQVKAVLKKKNDPNETPIMFIQNYALKTFAQTLSSGEQDEFIYHPKTTLPPYVNYTSAPLYKTEEVVSGGQFGISPSGYSEADNTVRTAGTVKVPSGSSPTYYVAGNEVLLEEGFEAEEGSTFEAWAESWGYHVNCGSATKEPFSTGVNCYNTSAQAHREATEPAKQVPADKQAEINVYPVPASNNIYISGLSNTNRPIITIIDQSGRTVQKIQSYSFNTAGNASLDVSNLSSGVYFISIQTTASTVTKKIVISK
jgi:type IX secretion system substrate protein